MLIGRVCCYELVKTLQALDVLIHDETTPDYLSEVFSQRLDYRKILQTINPELSKKLDDLSDRYHVQEKIDFALKVAKEYRRRNIKILASMICLFIFLVSIGFFWPVISEIGSAIYFIALLMIFLTFVMSLIGLSVIHSRILDIFRVNKILAVDETCKEKLTEIVAEIIDYISRNIKEPLYLHLYEFYPNTIKRKNLMVILPKTSTHLEPPRRT